MPYMLILVLMTGLTLMQGHNGSAKAKLESAALQEYSATKQAIHLAVSAYLFAKSVTLKMLTYVDDPRERERGERERERERVCVYV